MRSKIVFIGLIFSLFACESNKANPEDLLVGKWQLNLINGESIETNEGLQFAPNKQFFRIDSQGKPIPKLMEKIWSINHDTLTLIDYNWEPEFIDKKGTKLFLINSLNEEILDITRLNEDGTRLVYKPFR